MSIGNRIKELRKEKNMTHDDLSKLLNVGKSTISNYERDYRKPDIDTLNKLADIYNCSTDYLLGRTDMKK